MYFNSRTPRDMKHFGNPKNENLLRGPKFYGENEFLVEMCIFSTKKIKKKKLSISVIS